MLAQSGSYWWGEPAEELPRRFEASPRLPLRFYIEVGQLETSPVPNGGATMLESNRHLCSVLHEKGYPVAYREYAGGHDFASWRGGLARGLISLLGTPPPGPTP